MNVQEWKTARRLIHGSTSVAVCTIGPDGGPHATPIGSLILHHSEPKGYWLEKFPSNLPRNLEEDKRVQVLATNGGIGYWLKSLWQGSFDGPPAVRLKGTVGALRPATDSEKKRFLKKVKFARPLKGHDLLWAGMSMAREITFEEILPVKIGQMWP